MTINTKIEKMTKDYQELYLKLLETKDRLQKEREKFPKKYIMTDDFEDLTIKASNLKHEAVDLFSLCGSLSTSAKIDVEHCTAVIKIEEADAFLKDHGFEKITDTLRESVVAHSKEMKELLKMQGKIEILFKAVSKLADALEIDETNMRVFAGYKHKTGF